MLAARLACEVNPSNAPRVAAPTPLGLAAITAKLWRPPVDLSVQFLDSPTAACKQRILSHANAWGERGAKVRFRETAGQGVIRVARELGKGYTSYVGTDNLVVTGATLNLEDWREDTAESWYRKVVRHEFGHALGFPHEHLRRALVALMDPVKTVAYFRNVYGWDEGMTRVNVLTALEDSTLTTGAPDATSVMCYQIPGSCTYSGEPIPGGSDIDEEDFEVVRKVYPGVLSGVFSFDLTGPGRYLLEAPSGWGVTAWTNQTIAFADDFMLMPDARLVCVPENYVQLSGSPNKVVIDTALKHASLPPGWVVRVGVGTYLPGSPGAETHVVVLATHRRPSPMVLLPSGYGWQSVV